jgi:Flp pilus assembly protein TadG
MAKTTRFEILRRRLRELRTANGANVSITFALATIPMVGFVGAAVDYSHANAVKAAMQMAADSTALMLSKNAATLNNSDLQTKAGEYFKALFTRTDATGLTVSATYTTAESKVVVNATSNVKTNFMGLMGFNSLNVAVNSQVAWGNTKLRVALVLDTTGSMASAGKMDALKSATKGLLTTLKNAASKDGDVYVSIIPFNKDVNVGKSNVNALWLDWTAWDASVGGSTNNGSNLSGSICYNGQLWQVNGSNWSYGGSCSSPSAGICYQGTLWNWNGSNFVNGGTCASLHTTWNGCVTDRGLPTQPHSTNYDTIVTPPVLGIPASLFATEQYDQCPAAIKPLSYDWTGLNNLIDSLSPKGMTNQNIGLVHGWMSLVGGGPYPAPPPEDPNYKYSKIIILMSDGLNTQNRWYNNANQIDGRQKLTCANVKAANITLYTIHVNTDGDPMSTLLKDCASSPDKFWMLTSANALVATFNTIGTQLSNLRIAK